jgi:hypothetical protein
MRCPDDNEIQGFVEGTLPSGVRDVVAVHVEGCETCRTLLAELTTVAAADENGGGEPRGRYLLKSILGAGGMGVVYEAHDRDLDRKVALKLLSAEPGEGEERARLRLQREALALAKLTHPNVITVYDVGVLDGDLFVAMELVVGRTLRAWLASGAHSVIEVLAIARQGADGLAAAHAAGLVHRDFKPENLLVGDDGRVRVTDFGLARTLTVEPSSTRSVDSDREAVAVNEVVTRAGARAGTPAYMSPEQLCGSPLSAASDWYAFGATLYEALTGRLPFGPAGRRADASDAVPPSMLAAGIPPDLDDLCVRLLSADPASRPEGAEVLRRLEGISEGGPEAWPAPVVARQSQLERLEAAFQRVTKGRVAVVEVRGGSGMGKTALVERFTEGVVRRSGAVLLSGRCQRRRPVAFDGFDGLVDSLTAYLRSLPTTEASALVPAGMSALARIFPVLARVEPVAAAPRRVLEIPDPHELRRRGFVALRECVGRIAASRPVVLWIDDAEWADSDGAALLVALLAPPDPPPLMLVLGRGTDETGRADPSPLLAALRQGGAVESEALELLELDVQALPHDSGVTLARALHRGMTRATATGIAHRSQGHPYLLHSLVDHVASGGELDASAPATLDDALARVISRPPTPAASLLRFVAIAGGPVDESVAVRAAELAADVASEALRRLRADGLLRSARAGNVVDTFHERVREVVLASMEPAERRRHHARLSIVLLASGSEAPEVLVEHFRAAADVEHEAEFALVAADRAVQSLAFERAAELYARVMALGHGSPGELDAVVRKRIDALTAAGRWAEAARDRLRLAGRSPSPATSLELRTRAAEQLLCSGHSDEGRAILEDILRANRAYVPVTPLAALIALVLVRVVLVLRGYRPRAPRPMSDRERQRLDALAAAGMGLMMVDQLRGQYFQARALLAALAAGSPRDLERALFLETCSQSTGGRRTEARSRALLEMLKERAGREPSRYSEGFCDGAEAFLRFFLGDLEGALPLVGRAHQVFLECVGETFLVNASLSMHCRALMFLGRFEELRRRLAEVRREMQRVGDLHALASLVGSQSTIHLAADRPDLAGREIDEVAAILPKRRFVVLHFDHMVASAQRDLYSGRVDEAFERLERVWPRLRRSFFMRATMVRFAGCSLRGRVHLARAVRLTGREREGRLRWVEDVTRRLQAEGSSLPRGLALQLRAGVLACRGDAPGARRCAEDAERAFGELGMRVHEAASRLFRGRMSDGPEGEALVARAREALSSEGIRRPDVFAEMMAPGLSEVPRGERFFRK